MKRVLVKSHYKREDYRRLRMALAARLFFRQVDTMQKQIFEYKKFKKSEKFIKNAYHKRFLKSSTFHFFKKNKQSNSFSDIHNFFFVTSIFLITKPHHMDITKMNLCLKKLRYAGF